MRTITVYQADDGKIFTDKLQCSSYDWKINHLPDCVVWYDSENNYLAADSYNDIKTNYYKVKTMVIANLRSRANSIAFFNEYFGLRLPTDPGTYRRNNLTWEKIEESK